MKLPPSNCGLLPFSCPFWWGRGRFAFPFAFCGWWAFALGRAFPLGRAFALAFSHHGCHWGCHGFWIWQFLHSCTVWPWQRLWARARENCHCRRGGRGSESGVQWTGFNGHSLSGCASSRGVTWVHPCRDPCGTWIWGDGWMLQMIAPLNWDHELKLLWKSLWPIQLLPPWAWCQCCGTNLPLLRRKPVPRGFQRVVERKVLFIQEPDPLYKEN